MIRPIHSAFFVISALVGVFGFHPAAEAGSGDRGKTEAVSSEKAMTTEEIVKKYGIEPLQIRLTGAGHFLDFRYRVTDPQKAKPVLDRNHKAYLVDQESGKVLPVPVTKLGSMRGTAREPKKGRQYFILFGNANMTVDRGSLVTVVIDQVKVEGLVVE